MIRYDTPLHTACARNRVVLLAGAKKSTSAHANGPLIHTTRRWRSSFVKGHNIVYKPEIFGKLPSPPPADCYSPIMSSQSIPIALPLLVAVLALYLIKRWAVGRSGKHLPPGPKPLPIVGNLFDMPPARQWEVFAEWKERWGRFLQLSL